MFDDKDLIYTYTRAQAIADGVLIDAGEMAREAGFRWPVALTAAVWADCVRVPAEVPWQDESGRLWDILQLLKVAVTRARGVTDALQFRLSVQNNPTRASVFTLKAVVGPDDDGGPCITVMRPDED